MKVKIKTTTLSEGSKKRLCNGFGEEAARGLIFRTESTCKFFQEPSLMPELEFRGASKIEADLQIGLDCVRSLLKKQDTIFHLNSAYNKRFKCPSLDASKDDFGLLSGQTRETKIYRPDPNSAEYSPCVVGDDGKKWRNYLSPEEVGCLEMLERLEQTLEIAVERVNEAPRRKKGEKPVNSNDKSFIQSLAGHYKSCVGKNAANTPSGPFHRYLDIVTIDIGEGVTYTPSELKSGLSPLYKMRCLEK